MNPESANSNDSTSIEPPRGENELGAVAIPTRARHRGLFIGIGALVLLTLGTALMWRPWAQTGQASVDRGGIHSAATEGKYTCAMHPQIVRDGPGVCPICQMELVPMKGSVAAETVQDHSNMVHVSARGRIAADVRTVEVIDRPMKRDVQVSAGIEFNEGTQRVVSARYGGRIERLFVNQTGQFVRKGVPLMEIYSPELVTAQKEYLVARDAGQTPLFVPGGSEDADRARRQQRESQLVVAARKRLQLLGMSNAQIDALEHLDEISYSTTVFASASGVVVKRGVIEGAYVSEGTLLLELVDLSSVWVMANVSEADVYAVRPGMEMLVEGAALGNERLHGRVDYIYPVVDAQTRTVRVRGIVANNRLLLKPGMYVTATIGLPVTESLAVPASAVLRTGRRDMVYVEVEKNMFEGRDVTVGVRDGDYYQIVAGGLKKGDRVVADGGYLLDSEVRLSSSTSDPHAGMNMAGGGGQK